MRIFITGASGFIGSALIPKLIKAGHKVLGLARSDKAAAALTAIGADVHQGSLEDVDSLSRGAAEADGVIHAGFIHDFAKFAENCEIDRRAIEAMGKAMAGSNRPLLITSGTGPGMQGRPRHEDEPPHPPRPGMPRVSEHAAAAVEAQGVRVSVVRLPQVHDPVKQGLVTPLIAIARQKGVSAYVGDGHNRWPAVHISDAVQVYMLALDKGTKGARYHAVAEEGIALRDIAESIGRGLKIPVVSKNPDEAGEHFGVFAGFVAVDMPASSALTQQRLGWHPSGPGLISDLDQVGYM